MASRRRPSRARSRPTRAAGSGGESTGPGTRSPKLRGTKQTVPCPACGTEYRIPNELLDQQIACKNCGRAFTPSKASKRRIRSQSAATPFIVGGAILVFMIVGGLLVTWRPAPSEDPATKTPTAPVAETGMRNTRVRDVHDWAVALSRDDAFGLSRRSDVSALRTFLGIENIDGVARDIEERVLEALRTGDRTLFFRQSEVTGATIDADEADDPRGSVRIALAVKDEFRREWNDPVAEVPVRFRMDEGVARVVGWDDRGIPARASENAAGGVAGGSRTRKTGHEIIGEETVRETEIGGEKVVVREAELTPLPHLDDTPPELRNEIDSLIARLLDLDAPGATATRATNRLKEIGKPAIPRLLNALYETPLDSDDNLLRINRVTATLFDMTGQRFGFAVGVIRSEDAAKLEEQRRSALKQWYAWWARNAWRDNIDFAIDESEDLLDGEPREPRGAK